MAIDGIPEMLTTLFNAAELDGKNAIEEVD